MYGDGDICDGDGDGCDRDGVGMGRNVWGWGGYGENKLSPCSSLVQDIMCKQDNKNDFIYKR